MFRTPQLCRCASFLFFALARFCVRLFVRCSLVRQLSSRRKILLSSGRGQRNSRTLPTFRSAVVDQLTSCDVSGQSQFMPPSRIAVSLTRMVTRPSTGVAWFRPLAMCTVHCLCIRAVCGRVSERLG